MTGLVYHGPHDEPYYVTDSAYGIARAGHSGAEGIDLNVRTCRANSWSLLTRKRRIVVAHDGYWWEGGFKPKPGTGVPRKPIEKLTLKQVRRLVSKDGKHVILTAEEAALLCKIHGLFPFFEMKPSNWGLAVLRRLRVFCNARRIRFALMTIQAYGKTPHRKNRWERKAYQRMWLATQAKCPTVLLYRRRFNPEKWGPVLDGIKGHAGFNYSGGRVRGLTSFIRSLEKK